VFRTIVTRSFTSAFAKFCFFVCLVALIVPLQAQNNAVYDSSGTNTVHSSAFIDATVVASNNSFDLCATIYYIFTHSYPSSGAVIDARGLSGSALTCATSTSPWNNGANYLFNKPSVILLPPGTISTSIAWVLPNNTKLIGTAKGSGPLGTNNYILPGAPELITARVYSFWSLTLPNCGCPVPCRFLARGG
jgi:hypothetical protein